MENRPTKEDILLKLEQSERKIMLEKLTVEWCKDVLKSFGVESYNTKEV